MRSLACFAGMAVTVFLSGPAQSALVDLGEVAAISAGGSHACAVTVHGGAKCWGWNAQGQVGDGTTRPRPTPVGVQGLASGVAAISAGEEHACALTTTGGVKCWGANDHGQLGDGTTTGRLAPVDAGGLSGGVTSISAGSYHTCALTNAGGVKCWGREGMLGDGSNSRRLSPVDVSGFTSGVASIASGGFHTCALTKAGPVKCWGLNVSGQIGDGTTIDRTAPEDVVGLASGVVAVAAGKWHGCALLATGAARCWGDNSYGQVGDGNQSADRVTAPVGVVGLAGGVAGLSAGHSHTCARTAAGGVKCWGDNDVGQLGDGTTTRRAAPVDVPGMASGVSSILAGEFFSCGWTAAGAVKCWGANDGGQLGDDGTIDRAIAAPVRIARYAIIVGKSGAAGGRVISSPSRIDCGSACAADFTAGDLVTLAAVPDSGAYLSGWSGACSGLGPCSIVTHSSLAVTATFEHAANIPRLANLSARASVLTGDNVMIGGFVIGGATPKKVLVTARGPSLAAWGVPGTLANPSLLLLSGQAIIAANDDVATAPNLGEILATGVAPGGPGESAILATLEPGAYTAIVSGSGGGTGIGIVEIFEIDRPDVPLVNLSSRGRVQAGDGVLIGGFIIWGDSPMTVLVTARGPSLAPFGIADTLANPVLQLFSGQTPIASNDDMGTAANLEAILATGVAPTNPLESAILVTLNPGAYTAIVSGVGGATGVAIVEVFAR